MRMAAPVMSLPCHLAKGSSSCRVVTTENATDVAGSKGRYRAAASHLEPAAGGGDVDSALGAVSRGGGVCVLPGIEAELGQLVTCRSRVGDGCEGFRLHSCGICERVTIGGLELEGLAVLVREGVGSGVEGHAASEDERLCSSC